ncbi:DUF2993 domain-containing protein [Corynebacterium sp. sy017]|uniref:LmeA family phospholipid-binding protein n=1 Tax=unclassified Corynebacterium TaxID=2624378 RepID=UPI001186BB2B|nr:MULTISPECIES: LmeA family phospholipid-binding protein [unclassified Corynebacterium]MBP3089343.1 DUF2993 domain-containing protein [Corynebacterium sp. sy017]QDZ43278.1 DUF2993 domain-containing protein [Corynebacterium sp. sy039]TSD90959.1 DUF2993 domain-containing protein [Corynebacterium sp. SY003]
MSNKKLTISFSILIALIILLLAAEGGLRMYVGKQIAEQLQTNARTDKKATVSFGTHPLLLGVVKKNISNVTINTPATVQIDHTTDGTPTISGVPEATLNVRDLSREDPQHPIAGTIDLNTTLSKEFMLAIIQQQVTHLGDPQYAGNNTTDDGRLDVDALARNLFKKDSDANAPAPGNSVLNGAGIGELIKNFIQVTNLDTDPATGTLHIEISNGLAKLVVEPQAKDGKLVVTAKNTDIFGHELPAFVSTALNDGFAKLSDSFEQNLRIEQVEVVEEGMKLHLVGENVDLSRYDTAQAQER